MGWNLLDSLACPFWSWWRIQKPHIHPLSRMSRSTAVRAAPQHTRSFGEMRLLLVSGWLPQEGWLEGKSPHLSTHCPILCTLLAPGLTGLQHSGAAGPHTFCPCHSLLFLWVGPAKPREAECAQECPATPASGQCPWPSALPGHAGTCWPSPAGCCPVLTPQDSSGQQETLWPLPSPACWGFLPLEIVVHRVRGCLTLFPSRHSWAQKVVFEQTL